MRRNKSSRLLLPKQMQGLANAVEARDGGCLWTKADHLPGVPAHVCGGRLEAHHICEQSWIKNVYGKLGGIREKVIDGHVPHVRPKTRFEFIHANVTAPMIAMDPQLCVCLCAHGHRLFPIARTSAQLDIIEPQREELVEAIRYYSMDAVVERHEPMLWRGLVGS